jgi:hypothetical protein
LDLVNQNTVKDSAAKVYKIKRAKIFTKLVREIITAASLGQADPGNNPLLSEDVVVICIVLWDLCSSLKRLCAYAAATDQLSQEKQGKKEGLSGQSVANVLALHGLSPS